ncbi:MAG TPA: hypothetical protein VJJ83_00645 [Candidatus Babeliales bacterium]|nr:hypothetical protein [Candidatus Babeliales bacterium]
MLKYLMQIKRFSSLASILAGLSMSWNVAGAAVAPAPVPAAADDILAAVVTNWRRHDTGDVPLPTTIAVPAAIDMLYFGMPVRPSLRPSRGTIPTGIIIDTRPTDRRTERLSLANPHAVAELLALADHTLAAQRLMAEYQPQALVTAALQAEEHRLLRRAARRAARAEQYTATHAHQPWYSGCLPRRHTRESARVAAAGPRDLFADSDTDSDRD